LVRNDLFRIVSVEPSVCDDGSWEAVACVHTGQPLRFGDLSGAIHLGFAMHRRQHVVGIRILQVVFRQIVAPDRIVRPEEEMGLRLVGEERVTVSLQVPKVVVCVEERDRCRHIIPLVTDRLHIRQLAFRTSVGRSSVDQQRVRRFSYNYVKE
jgi:hypothetical protein